ncbi:MAG: 50S ribosomal protein L17 [Cyclobacteriaceae bacterium]|jgi:large subunit ribosomal protein L17|nr:50S ribosomal protein L17 [Cyclobacteriaceae bacterium]
MRHGKKINHLGRTAPHRKAMLSNMATSLIMEKRITTTLAKAKALRKYVEPLITKAKNDSTHSRRVVFSYLQNKYSVTELFGGVVEKIAERPGGYTRIFKTGYRKGDNADMCIMELVDYNELLLKDSTVDKSKTRRSRRGKGETAKVEETVAIQEALMVEETAETTIEEAVVEEVAIEEAPKVVEEVAAVAEETMSEVPEAETSTEAAVEEVKDEPTEDTGTKDKE